MAHRRGKRAASGGQLRAVAAAAAGRNPGGAGSLLAHLDLGRERDGCILVPGGLQSVLQSQQAQRLHSRRLPFKFELMLAALDVASRKIH